ncbi:MAG: sigma-70 family RNA polymerase sigma factor [Myxococcota bacterium]
MPEPDAPSDIDLLRAWGAGDDDAGNTLVRRHFDSVFRFFSGRLAAEGDVTDLAQKTFLACLESKSAWDGIERFRPFLLGVARNQLLMYLRYHRVRQGEQPGGSLQERIADSAVQGLSTVAASRERQRQLLLALRRLPSDLQMTLELHYWEGFTTKEIGEVLGLSPGTIKARLFKARARLKESIADVAGAPELADLSMRQLGDWAKSIKARVP